MSHVEIEMTVRHVADNGRVTTVTQQRRYDTQDNPRFFREDVEKAVVDFSKNVMPKTYGVPYES